MKRRDFLKGAGVAAIGASAYPVLGGFGTANAAGSTVKVGILHSLSGTMAISEIPCKNAELMAIDEINAAGGVMGRKIEPVVVDGASDWPTFAQKAKQLIVSDKVATVFGCWTSASRKAVKPVFEHYHNLLWYPVQYEGNECSKNIIYTGACPNQQIEPAVEWLFKNKGKKFFLVGSDYVFPRTANAIIKGQVKALGGEVVGEEYAPLGHMEFSTIVNKIKASGADVVFSTINGDSNVPFYKQYAAVGLTPEKAPIMAVSVAEVEVQGIGPQYCAGHYASWNYFETTSTPGNPKFVEEFKKKYGQNQVVDDPIEHGYLNVYLWKKAVEKAKSFDPMKVRAAASQVSFDAPQGMVKVDAGNQNMYQVARVGEIMPSGMFKEVWSSGTPVKPEPYSKYISDMMCDWPKGLVKRS
jgi:urea transport system substrate-binding protein